MKYPPHVRTATGVLLGVFVFLPVMLLTPVPATAATTHESHGLKVTPGFVNSACANYALAGGSALIDKGVVIPDINDRGTYVYRGAALDIGAFEYSVATTPAFCLDLPLVVG